MRIVLSRGRGKQVVYLFPEKDRLRVVVSIFGVGGVVKTSSERTLDWKQVLAALQVEANPGKAPWSASTFDDQA